MSVEATLARAALRALNPLQVRLRQRSAWWSLGRFPLRSQMRLDEIVIGGQRRRLHTPPGEEERQHWEFNHLHVDDPYRLRATAGPLARVIDIGGNCGFFALLARAQFPEAVIHCYEPNPALHPVLRANTDGLKIQVYGEGVGARPTVGVMQCTGASLEGSLRAASQGEAGIPIVPLGTAIQRMGGSVDFLKMDCEGAEWEILQDEEALGQVRFLAMEYHLDGGPERTLLNLLARLKSQGFRLEALREAANPLVGQLFAERLAPR